MLDIQQPAHSMWELVESEEAHPDAAHPKVAEPAPCDDCPHRRHCASTGDECRAWDEYITGQVQGGRRSTWLPGDWLPEWRVPEARGNYMTCSEIARLLGVARSTLFSRASAGGFPPADAIRTRMGKQVRLWRAETVRAWVAASRMERR